ncbi:cyclic peptide export ABC transporter [Ruegeria sp. 2205SS24-7]|uniref:cyclic peptide export ABC transporter n=1 Tax=Ruegeria discodermiae TaxID=3064389 RepID=UPI00274248D3|nr:cyclic peptide export ABC transporter [Ruegeria sp. 2205SS24-7]MDP5218857.1 cyclic peptide export ABC transporter [Ruegeria sp. 2205SS24-7]
MEFLRQLLNDLEVDRRRFLVMLALSALATTMTIAVVNLSLGREEDDSGFGLALYFLLSIIVYSVAQRSLMQEAANGAERMIADLRRSILEATRDADYAALQRIGRAPIYKAVTQEAQTISDTLPLIVVGAQQSLLLIFMSLYIAYLSTIAFVLVGLFGIFAVGFHVTRLNALHKQTDALSVTQNGLFTAFRGMHSGIKEITFNEARGADVEAQLRFQSDETRATTNRIRRHWAREYVLTQTLFYILLGVMVFVVPLFTDTYHDVVLQATMAALFMIGALSSLAQGVPAVNNTIRALRNIHNLNDRLRAAAAESDDEHPLSFDTQPKSLTLEGVSYTFHDAEGRASFVLQPTDASFHRGQISFITGGNGSGKSTLFRLMTGLVHPDAGRLLLDRVPIEAEQFGAYRDGVGVVFSDYYMFRSLFGLEDVDPSRVAALLAQFELSDKVELADGAFTTTELSAGQRKRLALIVALLQDAPILMLDEWAADQDPHFRRVFYREVLPALAAEGRIVICITHDEQYFDVADTVYAMADGQMAKVR